MSQEGNSCVRLKILSSPSLPRFKDGCETRQPGAIGAADSMHWVQITRALIRPDLQGRAYHGEDTTPEIARHA